MGNVSKGKLVSYISILLIICILAFLVAKYIVRDNIGDEKPPIDTSEKLQIVEVTIMDKRFIIVGIQIVLIFTIVIIVTLFIRLNNAVKLEKRISRYSVRYDNSRDNTSMFDNVLKKYLK